MLLSLQLLETLHALWPLKREWVFNSAVPWTDGSPAKEHTGVVFAQHVQGTSLAVLVQSPQGDHTAVILRAMPKHTGNFFGHFDVSWVLA